MLDDYWRLMPDYQQVALEDLTIRRILFGTFPTFRSSPLQPGFDRVLQVGDASGIQSPLSFGGFGALTRHLPRLARAIPEALQVCMPWRQCSVLRETSPQCCMIARAWRTPDHRH
jgi:hypothetical protein